jgi:hypothetical protein
MSQEGVMRIRRRITQDGFAEALAKAHNDGWVEGFRLGKEEGIKEGIAQERAIMPPPPIRNAVHQGNYYLGKHIDTIGKTFSIYVDESPIVLPYRRERLLERLDNRENIEVQFAIQSRLSIERGLIGREIVDSAYRDSMFTAYYIPYRKEGYLL